MPPKYAQPAPGAGRGPVNGALRKPRADGGRFVARFFPNGLP